MSKAKPRDTYLPVSLVDVKNLLQYDSARKNEDYKICKQPYITK